jgi:hypothetical protein
VDDVVMCGCVVEVVAPTVVEVDGRVLVGARVGGGTGRAAVEATVVDTAAAGVVVEVVVAVVDVEGTVEADAAGTAAEVVVGFELDDGAADDPRVVVDSVPRRLASFTPRDPPGGPPSTSAPAQSAATPMRRSRARPSTCVVACGTAPSQAHRRIAGRLDRRQSGVTVSAARQQYHATSDR